MVLMACLTSTAVAGSLCVQDGNSGRLCLQGLIDDGSQLQAHITWLDQSLAPVLLTAPSMKIEDKSVPLLRVIPFKQSGEAMDMVLVVQRLAIAPELWPAVRAGLSSLLDVAYQNPKSRAGVMGYGSEKATYEPLVIFDEQVTVRKTVDQLEPLASKSSRPVLQDALGAAIDRLDEFGMPHRQKHLIVFSDGTDSERDKIPDGQKASPQEKLFDRLVQRANRAGVTISVVLLSDLRPKYLTALVDATGGNIFPAAEEVEPLKQAFVLAASSIASQNVALFSRPILPSIPATGGRREHAVSIEERGLAINASVLVDWAPPAQSIPLPGQLLADREKKDGGAAASLAWLKRGLIALLCLGLLAGVLWGGRLLFRSWKNDAPRAEDRQIDLPESGASPVTARVGADENARYWLYDPHAQDTYFIPKLPCGVGNDLDCDVLLPGVQLAQSACIIESGDDSLVVRPWTLGREGARVTLRGSPMDRPMRLRDGDEIIIANRRLIFFEGRLD